MTKIQIRNEIPTDIAAIEAVTVAAFLDAEHSSHTEQYIVRALRRAGQLSISLVAEADGELVGHVAVSPVSISRGVVGWFGLGPISVLPDRQRQGIGSQLMQRALSALEELNAQGCVVLGDPNYYRRFGFQVEPSLILPNVPTEYFQAVSFCQPIPSGIVSYHAGFNATE